MGRSPRLNAAMAVGEVRDARLLRGVDNAAGDRAGLEASFERALVSVDGAPADRRPKNAGRLRVRGAHAQRRALAPPPWGRPIGGGATPSPPPSRPARAASRR